MRSGRDALLLAFASLGFAIAACKGGPGTQPSSNEGDQYDGVSNSADDDDNVATSKASSSSSSSSSTSSSGTVGVGTSTSSSTSGAVVTTPPPDLKASDYPQTCANDSECAAIYQGPVCTPCQCPNAAIEIGGETQYTSDKATRKASCPATTGEVECAACATAQVHCDKGSNKCAPGAAP